jgi:UDP-N-acetylglucosamine 2-epimerase (non-hydrolysing)
MSRRRLQHFQDYDWILVHGDTLSTLVGAIWARRTRRPLAHVEAGLRSKSLFNPFPEEINRRWVSKLAQVHFPPDDWSKENLLLAGVKGKIIPTSGNTMGEALNLILQKPPPPDLPKTDFVLANIHRFENLNSDENWAKIKNTLALASEKFPIYMVMHPSTEKKIREDKSGEIFKNPNFNLISRKPFHEFAHWLKACRYLISDGGSNQEECSYLGKPCLILRHNTERQEGLGASCVLSRFNSEIITDFLKRPEHFLKPPRALATQPSQIILDSLA